MRVRVDGRFTSSRTAPLARSPAAARHRGRYRSTRLTGAEASAAVWPKRSRLALRLGGGTLLDRDRSPRRANSRAARRRQADAGQEETRPASVFRRATSPCRPTSPAKCGLSFNPPTPQLVQLQQPAGHVPDLRRPGRRCTRFDPAAGRGRDQVAFAESGAIGLRRPLARPRPLEAAHLPGRRGHDGAQSSASRRATLLETPWEEMPDEHQDLWLWGTGEEHITYTWKTGRANPEVRRPVRRHHPRAAREVSHRRRARCRSASARKVHAGHGLPRLRRSAAQPAGARVGPPDFTHQRPLRRTGRRPRRCPMSAAWRSTRRPSSSRGCSLMRLAAADRVGGAQGDPRAGSVS